MSSISYSNNSSCVDVRKFEYSNNSSRSNFVFLMLFEKSHIFLTRLAMPSVTWSFNSAVRGYHFYRKYWTPYLSQRLDCYHEPTLRCLINGRSEVFVNFNKRGTKGGGGRKNPLISLMNEKRDKC